MKIACEGQGKAVMDVSFVIRVVSKAMLYYKDKALQFKKCMWELHVKVFKRTFPCNC